MTRIAVNVTPPRWAEKASPNAAEKVVEAVWSVWPEADVRVGRERVVAAFEVPGDLTLLEHRDQRTQARLRVKAAVAPLAPFGVVTPQASSS